MYDWSVDGCIAGVQNCAEPSTAFWAVPFWLKSGENGHNYFVFFDDKCLEKPETLIESCCFKTSKSCATNQEEAAVFCEV